MDATPGDPAMNPSPTSPQGGRLIDEQAGTEQRTWAMFTHLVGLLAIFDGLGLISFIATVIMWRIKKDESPFLDDHGREATNFQLSAFLITLAASAVAGILVVVLIGVVLLPMVVIGMMVVRLVGGILAATAANRGEFYRYPMCFQLISR